VEGKYTGARLYQVSWYREVMKEERDASPYIETILSATEGVMIGGGFVSLRRTMHKSQVLC
jgi:hypothetical protein